MTPLVNDEADRLWSREFNGEEISAAVECIAGMPEEVRRVYVEVWNDRWDFVYGDLREYVVPRLLQLVVRGRSFRVKGVANLLTERPRGGPMLMP